MSQPAPEQPDPSAPVNVGVGQFLAAVHDKWDKLVRLLVQENAEQQAGLEAQAEELKYLRSVTQAQAAELEALRSDANNGPAAADPLG